MQINIGLHCNGFKAEGFFDQGEMQSSWPSVLKTVAAVKSLTNSKVGVSNRWNEYGMEQWNGKWNGMVNVHIYIS